MCVCNGGKGGWGESSGGVKLSPFALLKTGFGEGRRRGRREGKEKENQLCNFPVTFYRVRESGVCESRRE